MPQISVVIPTYNRRDMLKDAIESVLAQTYPDWELIIVDDGSEQPVAEALTLFDPRIRIVRHPECRGAAAARNTGIREASTELITFLDDDDLWFPGFLERMIQTLSQHPAVAMIGGLMYQYEMATGSVLAPAVHRRKAEGYITLGEIVDRVWMGMGVKVIRKHCLEAIGGFDVAYRRGEDTDVILRIAERFPCYFLDHAFGHYRIHCTNVSRDELQMGLDTIAIFEKFLARRPVNVNVRSIWRRIARQHYRVARVYASQDQPRLAFNHLAAALRLEPGIGSEFVSSTERLWQRCVKVLKPYAAVAGLGLAMSPVGPMVRKWVRPRQLTNR